MSTRRCSACNEPGGKKVDGVRCGFRPRHITAGGGVVAQCRRCEQDRKNESRRALAAKAFVKAQEDPVKRFAEIVRLTARKPLAFSELCDRLDLSPARLRKILVEAKEVGAPIHVEHDHVVANLTSDVLDSRIQDTRIRPVVGQIHKVAHITDTHLGSKYCLRAYLRDFVDYAYAQGVREVIHTGDVTDGDYRHGKFEMSHMGLEEQTRDLFEVLPQKKGLTYHGIGGNHDFTFTESSGVNVGRYIENYFREHGRNDIKFYGDRGAFVRIRGAVFHLWHPSGGVSYALSYKMQKKIESYSPGEKPHVLLIGHWHRFAYIIERGVHAVAGGTFQGGGSAFGKSLTSGAPAIGGSVLSFSMTADGTMRNFAIDRRNYFEVEKPAEVRL